MPDTKITALTALTAADPANDMMPIVDVSDTSMAASGTTKRISINNILACSPSATLASATITGDLTVDTNVLKVDSTNNRVGVGTATPDNQLSVRAASVAVIDVRGGVGGAGALQISGNGTTLGTTSFDLIQNSVGAFVYQRDALPLFFNVNGSERYAISSAGVATWSNVGGVAGTAMTLNSTGLGVGVTPSSAKLEVNGAGRFSGFGVNSIGLNTTGTAQNFVRYTTAGADCYIGTESSVAGGFFTGSTAYATCIYNASNTPIQFFTNGSVKATLDASGNLLVGKTSASVPTVGFQSLSNGETSSTMASSTSAASTLNVYSTGATAYRFYVALNGTISATNTTISAISDARLKENVQDIDVGLGAILALKPRKFDWKAGKGKDIKGDRGFIAQEFEQVFPQLVDEWKDAAPEGEAPYKSVRQDLIPVLVKAIQELTARVQTLEAK